MTCNRRKARPLPPLRAIEAFLAVARTLSYAEAAEELHVTKSAVTRRIQALEQSVGARLFCRRGRTIELTGDGRAYFKLTGPAFDALNFAAATLATSRGDTSLRLSLPPSCAANWLIPRLSRLYERHPEIDLELDTAGYEDGIETDRADVAIRVARTPPPAYHSDRLMPLVQFPVCCPSLLRSSPVRRISDLGSHTRLALATMPNAWSDWLDAVGHVEVRPRRTLEFDTMPLLLQAARDGLGIAIGIDAVCSADLREGRLVTPFRERLDGTHSVFLICRARAVANGPVKALREWVLTEGVR